MLHEISSYAILSLALVASVLGFGFEDSFRTLLSHSCIVKLRDGTWDQPRIRASQSFEFPLSAPSINLAKNVFEGMKMYKGEDGKVRVFRVDYKMDRMLAGAKRVQLPPFDREKFKECFKKMAHKFSKEFPDPSTNGSIYIRPMYHDVTAGFDLKPTASGLLSFIGSKVGPFYAGKIDVLTVRVEMLFGKNFNYSMAFVKNPANYAATFLPDSQSKRLGYDTTLWLYHGNVAELSEGNVFLVLRTEDGGRKLVTAPVKYIAFPGSFRDAIITIAKEKGIEFEEKLIPIKELKEMADNGDLLEMFSSGHMASVTPITKFNYDGKEYRVPTLDQKDALFSTFFNELYSYFFGRKGDTNGWIWAID